MNYLSHAYLSFGNEELLVGNFIADKVKGKKYLNYPGGIQKGILLHRQIDYFTDTHPIVRYMIDCIYPNNGRYSPIIVDVFMDHFLAVHWEKYHTKLLQEFVNYCLNVLEKYKSYIPIYIQDFIEFAKNTNQLVEYRNIECIHLTLKQISKKLLNQPQLESAVNDLKKHYITLQNLFLDYFPQVISYCKAWITQNFPNLIIEN